MKGIDVVDWLRWSYSVRNTRVGIMMNSVVIMQVCSKSRTVVFMRYIPNDMRKHLKVIVLFNAFTSINCL